MNNHILAGYNAELTILIFGVIFIGLVLTYKIKNHIYNWVFEVSLGLFLLLSSELVRRVWWSIWKDAYISRDSVSWMMNHPIVLITSFGVCAGVLFLIKGLTRNVNNGRYWFTALISGIVIYILTLLKG